MLLGAVLKHLRQKVPASGLFGCDATFSVARGAAKQPFLSELEAVVLTHGLVFAPM